MANKNDFTPEEWTKVLESIIAAGIAVSAVDPSGLWGTLKEAAAGTPALAAAKRDPNSNELINQAAVADFERSNDGSILAMRERFAQAEPTECVQRSLASLRYLSEWRATGMQLGIHPALTMTWPWQKLATLQSKETKDG